MPTASFAHDGTWRSPVAHLNGVQGVVGSNPTVPTSFHRFAYPLVTLCLHLAEASDVPLQTLHRHLLPLVR